MEKIIGYKFTIIEDNGESCEWWREYHLESPLYTTLEAAEASIQLVKQKMLKKAKEETIKYFEDQSKYEYKHCRDINKLMCECCRYLYNQQKEILKRMSFPKIVVVCASTEPTDNYKEWNIGG